MPSGCDVGKSSVCTAPAQGSACSLSACALAWRAVHPFVSVGVSAPGCRLQKDLWLTADPAALRRDEK